MEAAAAVVAEDELVVFEELEDDVEEVARYMGTDRVIVLKMCNITTLHYRICTLQLRMSTEVSSALKVCNREKNG